MPQPQSLQSPGQPVRNSPATRSEELDERRLVALVTQHDLDAFDALYRRYHPRLMRFLNRMTRRLTMADELINDTMFVVWSRADSFDGTSKVSTWIFGIAYRNALKALRRLDEPVNDEQADLRPSNEPGPEQALDRRQARGQLLTAMSALSAEHRAVVDLTYFHGADYREIAQIVDCPVATVKTRMFHARQRLKALLKGQLEDWI